MKSHLQAIYTKSAPVCTDSPISLLFLYNAALRVSSLCREQRIEGEANVSC